MTDNTNKGFWERMARIYTAFMSKNDTAYRQICKLSEQYIDSEKSVLELACGTGQITFLMAGKSGSWEATDYSENMIKEIVDMYPLSVDGLKRAIKKLMSDR